VLLIMKIYCQDESFTLIDYDSAYHSKHATVVSYSLKILKEKL
jgi:hypothetical protein